MTKCKNWLYRGCKTKSSMCHIDNFVERAKGVISEYEIAKIMAFYVDYSEEKSNKMAQETNKKTLAMNDEQLQLFFKRQNIYRKKEQACYKKFVHNTSTRGVPCHRGVLRVMYNKMDATTWSNSPQFLIKDVKK